MSVGTGAAVGTPTAAPVITIEQQRPVPPEGQALLDTLHPPSRAWGRLQLWWVPGDVWQPVHRWVVFQCQHSDWLWQPADPLRPSERTPLPVLRDLMGPHPRRHTRLTYVRAQDAAGNLVRRPRVVPERPGQERSLVDRHQWECAQYLLRTTGEWWYPRWFWVIQGTHGGHPFHVQGAAAWWWQQLTGLPDVPAAGTLDYAPLDERVIRRLAFWDTWRVAQGAAPGTKVADRFARWWGTLEAEANAVAFDRFADEAEAWADECAFALRQDGYHRLRMRGPAKEAAPLDEQRAAAIAHREYV